MPQEGEHGGHASTTSRTMPNQIFLCVADFGKVRILNEAREAEEGSGRYWSSPSSLITSDGSGIARLSRISPESTS